MGRPARFAFFSASLFAAALREAGFGSVELATEAAYEAALQAVNDLLHNHALARNLPAELRYRGPQCWSHRRDLARSAYEPLRAMNDYAAESARRAACAFGVPSTSEPGAGDASVHVSCKYTRQVSAWTRRQRRQEPQCSTAKPQDDV